MAVNLGRYIAVGAMAVWLPEFDTNLAMSALSETVPGFQSIQAPDLVAMVGAQLRDAILEGCIALGERIVEADLARRMGISRAPAGEQLPAGGAPAPRWRCAALDGVLGRLVEGA